ncbi:MAG: NADH-quinone oxidoreductase subunit D [Candidatus Latescibacteria bacterium]|nr:NADH-quinone oxidoreductase subunit D [Candidatus Latescibacterota bacterium]
MTTDSRTGLETREMVLNMGPQHPSTHGVLRLEVVTDGELVVKAIPHIGYLHRCFEKHAEALSYQTVIPYVDRLDYLASMNNDLGYAIAVETLMGKSEKTKIELSDRVEYIRVVVAELNRIASHLMLLGTFTMDLGAITPFTWLFRDREYILDLFEEVSGARLLYNYIRVGGVSYDFPPGFEKKITDFIDETLEPHMAECDDLITFNKIFIERAADVGVVSSEEALAWALSGPMLRGSGVGFDLRKDDPYSVYDRFDFEVAVGDGRYGPIGSCWDRYYVRRLEIDESIKIIRQALEQMPDATEPDEVRSAIPKTVRPPEGEVYVRTENPRGELGFFVRSDGSANPFRIKGRSPCFCNLSIMERLSEGCLIADLITILGSVDIVLGEVDR